MLFSDIRTHLGATSTMVTGYLIEQRVVVTPQLATALLYGIESETTGYPREASSLDDGALIWLFPRADKDLLAQIRNPKLPQSHFATFQTRARQRVSLRQAGRKLVRDGDSAGYHRRDRRLFHPVRPGRLVARRGSVRGPAEALAPRGLRWAAGRAKFFTPWSTVSARPGATTSAPAARSRLPDRRPETHRIAAAARSAAACSTSFKIDEQQGRRLLNSCPVIPAP